ncbi:MAG TPA: hypothetical protein VF175_04770 [Lacipirellula sp.]
MHDDAFQEVDGVQEAQDPWRMGHRRPWWQWNVITLFVVLFALVWARELLHLGQSLTWLTCAAALAAWSLGPIGWRGWHEGTPAGKVSALCTALSLLMLAVIFLEAGRDAGILSFAAVVLFGIAVRSWHGSTDFRRDD